MPPANLASPHELDPATKQFYLQAMRLLDQAGVEFLVGGAYALARVAGIVRHTKDFDVFIRKSDLDRAINAFEEHGCHTQYVFPHWLAKAYRPGSDDFVDIIYSSGNGLCTVDDGWFKNAPHGSVMNRPTRLLGAEEILWTKCFVQERERFDGGDIAHIIWSQGPRLSWKRLLKHFEAHEHVLLAHLVLFRYIYPHDLDRIPDEVLDHLWQRVREQAPATDKVCRGTFLSREQYLIDIRDRGFIDARLDPRGPLAANDVAHWTAAIGTIR